MSRKHDRKAEAAANQKEAEEVAPLPLPTEDEPGCESETEPEVENGSVHHDFLLMAHMWKGKRVAWIGDEFKRAQELTEPYDAEVGPAQAVVIWSRMTRESAASRDEMMAYAKRILCQGGHIIIVDWCIQPGMVGAIKGSLSWSGFAASRLEWQSGPYGCWTARKP